MKKEEELTTNVVDIPKCGGKAKPTSPPEDAGKGQWVCSDDEWTWKEELGGV